MLLGCREGNGRDRWSVMEVLVFEMMNIISWMVFWCKVEVVVIGFMVFEV